MGERDRHRESPTLHTPAKTHAARGGQSLDPQRVNLRRQRQEPARTQAVCAHIPKKRPGGAFGVGLAEPSAGRPLKAGDEAAETVPAPPPRAPGRSLRWNPTGDVRCASGPKPPGSVTEIHLKRVPCATDPGLFSSLCSVPRAGRPPPSPPEVSVSRACGTWSALSARQAAGASGGFLLPVRKGLKITLFQPESD